jgi:hypothetical protein
MRTRAAVNKYPGVTGTARIFYNYAWLFTIIWFFHDGPILDQWVRRDKGYETSV